MAVVTRARQLELFRADSQYYGGKKFSGLRVGTGKPLMCIIYNKAMEIKRSQKDWFRQVWSEHGWEGSVDVWRVEFQLRRAVLKECSVNSVADIAQAEDGLWAYLTQDWLTLRQPGSVNTSRRSLLKRKWSIIQRAGFNQTSSPLVRRRVREANLDQLMNQASGLLVSIAALGDYADIHSTLESLGHWTEQRLGWRQTSFDSEKMNRRDRFLGGY